MKLQEKIENTAFSKLIWPLNPISFSSNTCFPDEGSKKPSLGVNDRALPSTDDPKTSSQLRVSTPF